VCGIIGYLGYRDAVPTILEGLKRLEYRGYDSGGIAVLEDSRIFNIKCAGKLSFLETHFNGNTPFSSLGIGHTRWATHGSPTDNNAHPHEDCRGKFAVVHNGIIENYQELKSWLIQRGHFFRSETDSEVVPHLLEEFYRGDFLEAVHQTVSLLKGSYALAIICKDYPNLLIGVRQDSPLVVGLGQNEYFLASDIPAFLNHTRKVYLIENGETVLATPQGITILDGKGQIVSREPMEVSWDVEAAAKGGYDHFMLKEIHEEPDALKKTIFPRLEADKFKVNLGDAAFSEDVIRKINKIYMVACGTAYHAGLIGKKVIEEVAGLPVEVDIASEFRYRNPLVDENTLTILISQSGETADTLAALREAKRLGSKVMAVTNVVGSSISREAEKVFYTWAGPEIAVASTKAYSTQLAAMYLIALDLAQKRGVLQKEIAAQIITALKELPFKVEEVLNSTEQIKEWAAKISEKEHLFFIGRALDHALAMEGALKLKEISYIHAEAYAAGELKHGTLALIEGDTPVVALATEMRLLEKTLSNIKEVKARGAHTFVVTTPQGKEAVEKEADELFIIPATHHFLQPVITVVPLQLLAYYTAVKRGCDVDQPRNLAKSVTVE